LLINKEIDISILPVESEVTVLVNIGNAIINDNEFSIGDVKTKLLEAKTSLSGKARSFDFDIKTKRDDVEKMITSSLSKYIPDKNGMLNNGLTRVKDSYNSTKDIASVINKAIRFIKDNLKNDDIIFKLKGVNGPNPGITGEILLENGINYKLLPEDLQLEFVISVANAIINGTEKLGDFSKSLSSLPRDRDSIQQTLVGKATSFTNDINAGNIKTQIKDQYNKVIDKIPVDKENLPKLRMDFFSSKEYKLGLVGDFNSYLNSMGYETNDKSGKIISTMLEYNSFDKIANKLKDKMFTKLQDMVDNIFNKPRDIEDLRMEFYNSEEYKAGIVTDFSDWVRASGYKIKQPKKGSLISRILKKTRAWDRKVMSNVTGLFLKDKDGNSKQGLIRRGLTNGLGLGLKGAKLGAKAGAAVPLFFGKHIAEGLGENAQIAASKLTGGRISDPREQVDEDLSLADKIFKKTRNLDRKVFSKKPKDDTTTETETKVTPNSVFKTVNNIKSNSKEISKSLVVKAKDKVNSNITKFKPKADKTNEMIAPVFDIKKFGTSLTSFIEEKVKTASKDNKKDEKKKVNPFDRDGDGDRDGNWKDRLASFGKKKTKDGKSGKKASGKDKKEDGLFGMLKGLLGGISGMLPKLLSVFGLVASTFKSIPGLISKILPGVTGAISSVASTAAGVVGKAVTAVKNTPLGGAVVNAASKAVNAVKTYGSGVVSAIKNSKVGGAVAGAVKKVGGSKIMSLLKSFKGKILKKLGKSAGGRLVAKLGGKISARLVPFAGAALLAYDAAMIGKDMLTNGTSLSSAISKQILGFDLFSDDDVPKDENGNPIKPDENAKDGDTSDTISGKDESTTKEYDDTKYKEANKLVPKELVTGEKNPPMVDSKVETSGTNSTGSIPVDNTPLNNDLTIENITMDKNVSIDGLNPAVLKNLTGMANDYNEKTGKKVHLNSAYRSSEYQAKLRAKYGSKAAKPGFSTHEFGLAFDINTSIANELEELGLMRKYGFTRPVGGETWHVEPAGVQQDVNASKKDPNLATQLTEASVYKGGGGQGLESGVRKYSRNKKLQIAAMDAPSVDVNGSKSNTDIAKGTISAKTYGGDTNTTASAPKLNLPANNADYKNPSEIAKTSIADTKSKGMSGVLSSLKEKFGFGDKPSIGNKDGETKPIDTAGKTTLANNGLTSGLTKIGKDTKIDKASVDTAKIDLAKKTTTALYNIDDTMKKSLEVQLKIATTLDNILGHSEESNKLMLGMNQNNPGVPVASNDTGNKKINSGSDRGTDMPKPAIDLKRSVG
jgi:hypothetical protein